MTATLRCPRCGRYPAEFGSDVQALVEELDLPRAVPGGILTLAVEDGLQAVALRASPTATTSELRRALPQLRAVRQRLTDLVGPIALGAGWQLLAELDLLRRRNPPTPRRELARLASAAVRERLEAARALTRSRRSRVCVADEAALHDAIEQLSLFRPADYGVRDECLDLIAAIGRGTPAGDIVSTQQLDNALRRYRRRFLRHAS